MANSFKKMILDKSIKRADSGMLIRLDDIHIRENFNKRVDDERNRAANEDLFNFIMKGGKLPALEVEAREGGGVWIVEGHRRYGGYIRARDAGKPVEWIRIDPFVGNDVDRVARIKTSNNQLPLTDYEESLVAKDLLALNLTPDEIAEALHVPRYKVDNYLVLMTANHDVQKLVRDGAIDVPLAVERVKAHGEAAGDILQFDAEKAKAAGKKRATKSTALPKFSAVKARTAVELLAKPDVYAAIADSNIPEEFKTDLLSLLDQYREFSKQDGGDNHGQ